MMNDKKIIFAVKNLNKNYGKEKVLKNFNFDLYEGDRVALLGLNGSGKTTLVEMILGLRDYQKGKIIYENGLKNFQKQTLVVFQIGKYPGNMKVLDLIKFYKNFYTKIISGKKIQELIEILEINKLLNKKINKLSFGQKKKVEVLVTLIIDNNYYIIDEITAGVDVNARFKIVKIFTKLISKKEKSAMIWITHDHNEIKNLCNRVVILSRKMKRIAFDGDLKKAIDKYQSIENMVSQHIKQEMGEIDFNFENEFDK